MRAGLVLGALAAAGCGGPPETNPFSMVDVEARLRAATDGSPHLRMESLGEVGAKDAMFPIWAVTFEPDPTTLAAKRVLLTGSIHGNEPAGAGALLAFVDDLRANPERYAGTAFDIVPVVNPWGIANVRRRNAQRRDLNRDFATFKCPEARIMRDFVAKRKYDLMIDFHEDHGSRGFYMYQLAQDDASWARRIIDAERSAGYGIERKKRMAFLKARDGIISAPPWSLRLARRLHELSMTNYFRLTQCDRVFLFETPHERPWDRRLGMHRIALDALLEKLNER